MTQLLSLDETTQVGEIIRQYTGCGQECFTDASNFSVTFPIDLDVKMKAVIFGATMLLVCYFINYFYENNRHPLYWGYKVFPWVDWGRWLPFTFYKIPVTFLRQDLFFLYN